MILEYRKLVNLEYIQPTYNLYILFIVMTTPSNEVLDNKIANMVDQNNKEHWEIKDLLTTLSKKIDTLESKYVTRLEFKAVSLSIWLIATVIWIIWFFIWK